MTNFREQQEHLLMSEVVRRYRDELQPLDEVARALGYGMGTLKRLLKAAGLLQPHKRTQDPYGFAKLFAEGKTLTEAAAAAKTSSSVARYWADKLKLRVPRHRRTSPTVAMKNEIVAALRTGEHAANVATHFDVRSTTVYKIAAQHGVKLARTPRLEHQIRFSALDVLHVLARAGLDPAESAAAMPGYSPEKIRVLLSRPRTLVSHRQAEKQESALPNETQMAA